MRAKHRPRLFLLALLAWTMPAWANPAAASDLSVTVLDAGGAPVADAVVTVRAVDRPAGTAPSPVRRTIDQQALDFIPYLEVFRPGDEVVFRNSDRTRHHVYSFSPVKSFEFVLAPNESSPPQRLDEPGVVAVGCNIHDQMISYLYVTDAPRFARTGPGGKVRFDALRAGDYEVRAWQPRLRPGRAEPMQEVGLGTTGDKALVFSLALLPDPRRQSGREHVHY